LKQYTPPAQIKQTLYPQAGVTYPQITKQNSYPPTNIEQDQHKPTSSANHRYTGLKKYDVQTFRANGNYPKPHHNRAY
jgi:hypothetical protein